MKRISTRTMKAMTIVSFLLGFALLFAVGAAPPRGSSKRVVRAYGQRALGLVGGSVVCLIVTAVGAYALARRTADEYREMTAANMRELLEGARQDHRRKREAADSDATDVS